ncbi:bacillithiol system redox-active protein YtxJ [Kaistella pullorum]|uniref:Bacillithiol system redox-active protein YtxJ n=1 Tax=Kaistella pullorum TaxID=2763074 RepID=A0ABR8WMU7_9FLAO|nr:bacillithiol system redox-active protein YtxJ [Kaistella pullorum]MBD8018273.1 bacillithiol system redox-active protein YtxJ [Kaistella pullorum]
MSFLDKILGKSASPESAPDFWKYIESESDLDKAISESSERKVAIFKHSTRCHISKMVLKNFEREVQQNDGDVSYYFLDLLEYRPISNRIESDLNVVHQSPQLIVLKDGKAINHMSHQGITTSGI